ncbi:DUF6984 family protein [Pandoraea anhela]|uniref:DUF6984 family protein n=1 Tax=Pandoraea anhela TaxID=2508295 RepID=UPI001C2D69A4|nr:hypothetical protein [Pandoraea anhela]
MRTRRKISDNEYLLVIDLISSAKIDRLRMENLIRSARGALVEPMSDGGMGSVKFVWDEGGRRKFDCELVEKQYLDLDNVPISAAINLDQYGELFELDIWKVDFSEIKNFPSS